MEMKDKMEINSFDQTKDIQQRVQLALCAARDESEDLLFQVQINERYLSDIIQICIWGNEEDHSKDVLFESLKSYYASWNHNKEFQSALLVSAGINRGDAAFFLSSSRKEYKSYLLTGTGLGKNALHVESVMEESECTKELPQKKNLEQETILAYRKGTLGFKTIYRSFIGWLFFKLKKERVQDYE